MKRLFCLLALALSAPAASVSAQVKVQSEIIELSKGETITSAYAVILKDELAIADQSPQTPASNTRTALVEKLGESRYRIAVSFDQNDFSDNTKYVVFATLSNGRVMSSPTRILSLKDTAAVPAGVNCNKDSQDLDRERVAALPPEELATRTQEKKKAITELEENIKQTLNRAAITRLRELESQYGLLVGERWSKHLSHEQLLERVGRLDCVAD